MKKRKGLVGTMRPIMVEQLDGAVRQATDAEITQAMLPVAKALGRSMADGLYNLALAAARGDVNSIKQLRERGLIVRELVAPDGAVSHQLGPIDL